ncbi:hypothetical protein F5B20DRAFT_34107 [Whalleya microplaca]|nr:hypothetical protein F5B20DRAFT_34107 [Whalleya microplaca]
MNRGHKTSWKHLILGYVYDLDIHTSLSDPTYDVNQVDRNIVDETSSTYGNTTQSDVGANMEVQGEAIKDRVDGAVAKGPKKADEYSGGRVQVGETGDLHDLAAKRQP